MELRARHWCVALLAAGLLHAMVLVLWFWQDRRQPVLSSQPDISGFEISLTQALDGAEKNAETHGRALSQQLVKNKAQIYKPVQSEPVQDVVATRVEKIKTDTALPVEDMVTEAVQQETLRQADSQQSEEVPVESVVESIVEPDTKAELQPHAGQVAATVSQDSFEQRLRAISNEPALNKAVDSPGAEIIADNKAGSISAALSVDTSRELENSQPVSRGEAGTKKAYYARLTAWLEQHKKYPRAAQRRNQQGTAYLRFVVDRHGKVLSYEIEHSSGHRLLDREVERIIRRARPLPAIPEGLMLSQLELVVPVSFQLR